MIAAGIDPETANGAVCAIERGAVAGLRLGDIPPRDAHPTWPDIVSWLVDWRWHRVPTEQDHADAEIITRVLQSVIETPA